MGKMFYKYSVWVYKKGKLEFFANCTTSTRARQLICQFYEIGANINKMWVKNNETDQFEGMVEASDYKGRHYVYTTLDSRSRRINTDGTFVETKKKNNTMHPFGL